MSSILLRSLFVCVVLFLTATPAGATSRLPVPLATQVDEAAAVCLGKVGSLESFRDARDGLIYTRAVIEVEQSLKGTFPARVKLLHRGGIVGGAGEVFSLAPRLLTGERRIFFLARRADGSLFAAGGGADAVLVTTAGQVAGSAYGNALAARVSARVAETGQTGADVSDQAAPAAPAIRPQAIGGLLDDSGTPARFLAPDRGEPIPVLVDFATLPAGLTQNQATQALANALNAWSNVTSLRFFIEGFTNFPTAASSINIEDGRLRIQMHDNFNVIASGSTLGIGGRALSIPSDFPSGGGGGRVVNQEFHPTTRAYVVLEHGHASMSTLKTFEEVLTHEIGHALGLDHSSETPGEANATLAQAVMYYTAHADGRGAQLGTYDVNIIRTVHPQVNTPPYCFDRVMRIVTYSGTLANPAVNQIELQGYDLQGTALTTQVEINSTAGGAGNGTFTLASGILSYTANNAFSDADADLDFGYFDQFAVRFSDGTNLSSPAIVRVVAYRKDTRPAGAPDGLPDSWMTQYFGSTTPVAGTSGPNDDPDGDGHTNLQEFLLGTVPTNATSRVSITGFSPSLIQWTAQKYDLYRLEMATGVTNTFSLLRHVPITGTNGGSALGITDPAQPRQFFRVRRVP